VVRLPVRVGLTAEPVYPHVGFRLTSVACAPLTDGGQPGATTEEKAVSQALIPITTPVRIELGGKQSVDLTLR
jgi:hypothetical protein